MDRREFVEAWSPEGKEEYKNFISDLAKLIVSERNAVLEEHKQKSAKPGSFYKY